MSDLDALVSALELHGVTIAHEAWGGRAEGHHRRVCSTTMLRVFGDAGVVYKADASDTRLLRDFVLAHIAELTPGLVSRLSSWIWGYCFDPKSMSASQYMVHIRDVIRVGIKDAVLRQELLDQTSTPAALVALERKIRSRRRTARQRAQFKLTYKQVRAGYDFAMQIYDPFREWIALVLVSGMRSNELLFSQFELPLPGDLVIGTRVAWDGLDIVKQVGISKDRGDDHVAQVVKPLLLGVNVNDFIARVERLRHYLDPTRTMTPLLMNQRYASRLADAATVMFPAAAVHAYNNGWSFGSHFARALYANLVWDLYSAKFPDMSRNYMLGHLLGHNPNDQATSVQYSVVRLTGSIADMADKNEAQPVDNTSGIDNEEHQRLIDTLRTKRPKHSSISSTALFTLKDGQEVTLPRLPRRKKLTREQHQDRIRDVIGVLVRNGVKVTGKNIKAMGIGASTYKNYRLSDEEMERLLAGEGSAAAADPDDDPDSLAPLDLTRT